ncbi:MAG: hypothetical protein DA330_04330 [Nitrososphaera sp.]|nr:hypothetical protein [Nitrososphaera sp.]
MKDYFEIDRLVDEMAKLYSTAFATAWFRIENKKPTKEEYRAKVVEFMKHAEYSMAAFPDNPAAKEFKEHANMKLKEEVSKVLAGENKEVEKRYKYFIDYS